MSVRNEGLKYLGLFKIWLDDEDEELVDIDELLRAAQELAMTAAFTVDEFVGHTRLDEVDAFAKRRGICRHEAIIRLVNSALSHGLG